jgi:FkbM family methyltransferase
MGAEVAGEIKRTTMMSDPLKTRLEALLAESEDSVKTRQKTAFDSVMGGGREIVIFGAGNFGKKALHALQTHGYSVRGFIDNNTLIQGTEIEGVRVFGLREAWHEFGDSVGIVVAIYFGEAKDTMGERIAPVREAGFTRIVHFGMMAWKFPEGLLPHYSLDLPSNLPSQRERIVAALALFTHAESRQWYVDHVEWRLTLDFDLLPRPVKETIYFHESYLQPDPQEFFVDGGAFTGDTLLSFVSGFGKGGFYKVLSFEPDPANFPILRSNAESVHPTRGVIAVYPSALGDSDCEITVESSGGPSSRVGHGETVIPCRTIDGYADPGRYPTFIKLDIEGHELPALRGAARTIREGNPVLAVSAYHKQNDLWEIPLAIANARPDYEFRLAPHVADGWDLVLYAAPKERFKH